MALINSALTGDVPGLKAGVEEASRWGVAPVDDPYVGAAARIPVFDRIEQRTWKSVLRFRASRSRTDFQVRCFALFVNLPMLPRNEVDRDLRAR